MCQVTRVTCQMSNVKCHMSRVTCHVSLFFFFLFWIKWWSLSVEGLLSTGPTPSSLYSFSLSLISWLHTWLKSYIKIKQWIENRSILPSGGFSLRRVPLITAKDGPIESGIQIYIFISNTLWQEIPKNTSNYWLLLGVVMTSWSWCSLSSPLCRPPKSSLGNQTLFQCHTKVNITIVLKVNSY